MAGKSAPTTYHKHFTDLSDEGERSEKVYFVLFQLDQQNYALPLENVSCALRMAAATPLLDAPPHIRGMINLHGEPVLVEDLRQRFGGPASDFRLDDRLLVILAGGKTLALMVDSMEQVMAVPVQQIKAPPIRSPHSHFLQAVFYRDDRPVMVLRPDALFTEG